MRQIKFRGKRVDNGEWVYGSYHYSADGKYHYILALEKFRDRPLTKDTCMHISEVSEVDPATVGQFTGLLDKNGKEVYDRDIVPTKFGNREIFWDEKRYGFCYTMPIMGRSMEGVFNIYNLNDPEVIGNLHDNPLLLTNK